MNCRDVRKRLTERSDGAASAQALEHLKGCAVCARYAARLETLRGGLREHHAEVEPDAGFVLRVASRLPDERTDALQWAAARMLPATLAVLAALVWFSWQGTPASQELEADSPIDDVLAWVIDETEVGS